MINFFKKRASKRQERMSTLFNGPYVNHFEMALQNFDMFNREQFTQKVGRSR